MNAFLVSLLVATVALSAVTAAPPKKQKVEESIELDTSNVNDNVTTTTTDLGQAMTELLTAFQKIMPCGDEDLGIPVMAPFRISKLDINVNEELLILKGQIKDLVMTGIDKFLIINLASNSSSNRTKFDILYEGIQLLGEFDLAIDADLGGFRYVETLKGLMDLQVLNIRVTGGMTIGQNENGGMNFSNVEYYVQVGDIIANSYEKEWSVAVNNFVNQYVRDSSMLFLQTNRDFLSEIISGYVTPIANNAFQNISSSQYLEALVEATHLYSAIDCSP